MKKEPTTSPGLAWIVANRNVLNIKGLEAEIGLPYYSLFKFLETGYFPAKWIEHLDKGIAAITSGEAVSLPLYIRALISQWKSISKGIKAKPVTGIAKRSDISLLDNAKQEQVLDDLYRLQEILRVNDKKMADFLYKQARAGIGKNLAEVLYHPDKSLATANNFVQPK